MGETTTTEASTREPVTTGGWYELTDGKVAMFTWRSGRLHRDKTVASWADVPTREQELDALVADDIASRR